MDNVLLKKDIVGMVSEKLAGEKIEIGGNGKKYKRKYHLKYTQRIIANVLDAFWEAVASAVEEGDSVKLNNYVRIEPRHYKAVRLNAKGFPGIKEDTVPARYKVRFIAGERLKEASRRLTQKKCGGIPEDEDP